MECRALLLALAVVAIACSPGAQHGVSSAPQDQETPEPTVSLAPTPTSAPSATPVARTISGRATLATTGASVAGVEVRAMPMPLNNGRPPGADATAVSDVNGIYKFTVIVWALEALAGSSSFQLMLDITPPPGLRVVGLTRSLGSPAGSGAAGPFILGDLDGPVDITLARGSLVEGRVMSGRTGQPLEGVSVFALRPGSILIFGGAGDAFEIEATASTNTTGRYSLTVPPGTYVIDAVAPQDAQRRFWSDDPAVFQATPLKVERNLAGIDLTLVPVTPLGGQVRSGPSFAEALAGVRVVAYLGGGSACCRVVGAATTGEIGTFVMYVPQGVYRIVFEPPAGSPYASRWWSGGAGFTTATDVTVGPERIRLEVVLAPSRP